MNILKVRPQQHFTVHVQRMVQSLLQLKNLVLLLPAKRRRFGVSYSGNYTFSRILRAPNFQDQFGQGWDGNNWLDENGSWGPEYDGSDRVWGRVVDNSQLLKAYSPVETT